MKTKFSKVGAVGCLIGFALAWLIKLISFGNINPIYFLFYWDIALSLTIAFSIIMSGRRLKW